MIDIWLDTSIMGRKIISIVLWLIPAHTVNHLFVFKLVNIFCIYPSNFSWKRSIDSIFSLWLLNYLKSISCKFVSEIIKNHYLSNHDDSSNKLEPHHHVYQFHCLYYLVNYYKDDGDASSSDSMSDKDLNKTQTFIWAWSTRCTP